MELRDHYGLALAVIEPAELDRRPWAAARQRIDVVRLPEPPAELAGELAARGFVHKPAAVTWLAELGPGEEAFLDRLERADRQAIRRAQRRAVAAGLREVVADPVTPELLDRFLVLYAARVARMRFGVPFALDYRDAVLNGPDKFFGVFAVAGDGGGGAGGDGDLVGGVLVLERPALRTAVLRFSAVSAGWRRRSLPRALYTAALRIAREKGYEYATLGDEPNLSGHLTKPGLFVFKAGLGFRPVPAQDFSDPAGTDEADLVLRLGALSDPTLMLGYPAPGQGGERAGPGTGNGPAGGGSGPASGARRPRRLAVNLVSESPVNTALYAAPSLAPTVLRRPGG